MISFPAILSWLATSRVWRAVAAAGAFLLAVLVFRAKWRSEGREEVLDDQQDDYIDRTAAGRAAGRDAERDGAGMTGQDRIDAMRRNDGKWP